MDGLLDIPITKLDTYRELFHKIHDTAYYYKEGDRAIIISEQDYHRGDIDNQWGNMNEGYYYVVFLQVHKIHLSNIKKINRVVIRFPLIAKYSFCDYYLLDSLGKNYFQYFIDSIDISFKHCKEDYINIANFIRSEHSETHKEELLGGFPDHTINSINACRGYWIKGSHKAI